MLHVHPLGTNLLKSLRRPEATFATLTITRYRGLRLSTYLDPSLRQGPVVPSNRY
jgi:hypothetical protein